MVETASQPSYNLNTTNTASISINFVNGTYLKSGNLPSIANYSYDFSASGLQTKTLGSGTFVVGHSTDGSGYITASATANAGSPVGSATITAKTVAFTDFSIPAVPADTYIWNYGGYVDISNSTPLSGTNGTQGFTIYVSKSGSSYSGYSFPYDAYYTPISIDRVATDWFAAYSVSYFDGNTATGPTAVLYGVPSTPSFSAYYSGGTNITVTNISSSTNGGYGGSPTYVVSRRLLGGGSWGSHNNSDSLTPGQTYEFSVYAYNSTGSSGTSTQYVSVPPLPAAPLNVVASRYLRNASVSWQSSQYNGSTVYGYYVYYAESTDGVNYSGWIPAGSTSGQYSTSFYVQNLTVAKFYKFAVQAYGNTGTGSFSTASNVIFIPAFGKKLNQSNTWTPITSAARYTGSTSDSVVISGVTYTGWKAISEVKKCTSINQDGTGVWTVLET